MGGEGQNTDADDDCMHAGAHHVYIIQRVIQVI